MPNLTGGMDSAIVDTMTAVPIFTPMLLVFIFVIVFIGGSTSQKKKTGFADMPMWSTIASVSCLMIALALSLVGGMINLITLVVVVIITILSGAWLLLGENNREI
jgi:CHASE2 domain-containing sensor protein